MSAHLEKILGSRKSSRGKRVRERYIEGKRKRKRKNANKKKIISLWKFLILRISNDWRSERSLGAEKKKRKKSEQNVCETFGIKTKGLIFMQFERYYSVSIFFFPPFDNREQLIPFWIFLFVHCWFFFFLFVSTF